MKKLKEDVQIQYFKILDRRCYHFLFESHLWL